MGIGISYISFAFERDTFSGFVIESKENYFIISSRLERLYVYNKNNSFEIGDYISINGYKSSLSFTNIESSFDFTTFLNKKGVYNSIEVNDINIRFSNPIRLRAYQTYFLSKFDEQTADLLSKLMFSNNVDADLNNRLSLLHINRLISVSGFYLYIYLKTFTFIFSNFMKEKWSRLCGLVFLSFYVLFNITRFSVIRFFTFAVLRYLNDYFLKKKLSFYTLIGATGLAFIIIDYHLAYSDAFILGYGCSVFNYLFNNSFSCKKKIYKKLLNVLLLLLFMLPFELNYYNEIALISYPFQILLSPLFSIYSISSLLCFYYVPLYQFVNKLTIGITWITNLIYPIQLNIYLPNFNQVLLIIYYLILFITIYYHSIHFKLIYPYCYLLLTSIILIYALPIKNRISYQVSFINVGQGDSCLVRVHNHSLLIDTGGSIYTDIATKCLIPYFKKQRIYSLEYVITTHDDYDHSGALLSLNKNFKIDNYINSPSSFPISFQGIEINNYNTFSTSTSDENEKSLVLGFKIQNYSFLIMGDAPTSVEDKIMSTYKNIECDVLKIGHHGSDSSTSDAFLKFSSPQDAIISVGKNYYGHPSSNVVARIKKNNINIRQTNIEGTISYCGYL